MPHLSLKARLVLLVVVGGGLLALAYFGGESLQRRIGPAASGVLGLLTGGVVFALVFYVVLGLLDRVTPSSRNQEPLGRPPTLKEWKARRQRPRPWWMWWGGWG
ncbi:MAG TPA: hypothetical protein VD997_13385 [Phycisphaerales bacterium]|nr:hypothetical protein [Phycisphaerales bacterium]